MHMTLEGSKQGKSQVSRATFNAVLGDQKMLFQLIETLISENRPLKPSERMDVLELFGRATLGTGTVIPISGDGGSIIFRSINAVFGVENAEELFGFAVYLETDILVRSEKQIPISELWKDIRALLLKIRPIAINRSISISAERIESPDKRSHGQEPKWI